MKRAAATVLFFGALGVLGGCPIYSHEDDGCYHDNDCAPGYLCDDYSGECLLPSADPGADDACRSPRECPPGYTCGKDGYCQPGDCYFSGCVAGFRCQSSMKVWECVSTASGGDGEAGAGGATSN